MGDTHAVEYVHGYSAREHERLHDQAHTLTDLLHEGTFYPAGSMVLEAGCGVGAQTMILARNSPKASFTSIDLSDASLEKARAAVMGAGVGNVTFVKADIHALPFQDESFDHIFLCFVLEHLPEPLAALRAIRRVLRPGGSITVIEGDHGSTFFHPHSEAAKRTIECLVAIQAKGKGNAMIGRQLFPLLREAGFDRVDVAPKMVYVDDSKPDWVEGFTKKTFIAMVEGVKDQVLALDMLDRASWSRGITDLYAASNAGGVFFYTFFKGIAFKQE